VSRLIYTIVVDTDYTYDLEAVIEVGLDECGLPEDSFKIVSIKLERMQ
jgi:hypothetical protein